MKDIQKKGLYELKKKHADKINGVQKIVDKILNAGLLITREDLSLLADDGLTLKNRQKNWRG